MHTDYTEQQQALIEAAATILVERTGMDRSNAYDIINENWSSDESRNTVENLSRWPR